MSWDAEKKAMSWDAEKKAKIKLRKIPGKKHKEKALKKPEVFQGLRCHVKAIFLLLSSLLLQEKPSCRLSSSQQSECRLLRQEYRLQYQSEGAA